ncbi:hypothetical protein CBR_g39672 [Chara braunii]|uniref:Uncharacterized protein n=1 Tax=Chara braunii TaxID=69332 RepID=A0A388K1G4_CHABU|nr:hypothetical protein CBR_g39672 [Chara braunii]|eukprot:GBG63891.1 hypothetical protein CBR_g39672 [Chara braunii]
MVQAAQTRGQSKASASQEHPQREPESERRKEAVEAEKDNDEDEQDDSMHQEEDRKAEKRVKKRGAQEEVEPVLRDVAQKKKKYAVRLEEGFDMEKVIDRLLEGHNDPMTLKEILTSAPKLRDGLKGRFSATRFTEGGLRGSPQHTRQEVPPSGGSLLELKVHLDISQWGVPQDDERRDEPVGDVPREEVHEPERVAEQGAQRGRAAEEVIEVGEDTPPQTPAHTPPQTPAPESRPEIVTEVAQEAGEELQQGEVSLPTPDTTFSPGVRVEMEREGTGWRREALSTVDRHLAAHAQEHPDIGESVLMEPPQEPHQAEREARAEILERGVHRTRGRAPARETAEERRVRVGKRVEEIWEERQRLEVA